MKEMTLEEKVQRSLDYQEIQNVMSAHTYCYAAQKQWYELDNFWSKRDDIAYGPGNVGRQVVRDYYGATNEWMRKEKLKIMNKLDPNIENVPENEGIGDMVLHLTTSPFIEIARNGQTAKGLWYSPSISCEIDKNGDPVPVSIWEKCAVDFIKEDGHWKIWHFRQYPEFFTVNDKSLVDGSRTFGRTASKAPPPSGGMPKMSGYGPYSAKRVATFEPELPQPYEEWNDSMSYIY